MPVVVRSPTRVHARIPDASVLGRGTPVSVFVEIFEADDLAGAVPRRWGIFVPTLAVIAPAIERIRGANLVHFRVQRRSSPEGYALTPMNRVALSVAGRLAFSIANRDDGVIAVFRGFDAIAPWLLNHERLIRRVDLVISIAIEFIHAHIDGAGAELNLHGAVVEIEKRESGIGTEIDFGRPELHFSS